MFSLKFSLNLKMFLNYAKFDLTKFTCVFLSWREFCPRRDFVWGGDFVRVDFVRVDFVLEPAKS